jgi:AcrR family transcriptional regulator
MPAAVDPIRILDSVLAVWREDGYQGATTRQVAALAGVSEMTLFRRFGDKAALFRAALDLEAERFAADAVAYTGSLSVDLERVVGAYAALLERSATIVLDVLLEAPRLPDLARIRPAPLAAIAQIAVIIARYQREGQLRPGAPVDAILALLSPVLMAALLRRAQPELAVPTPVRERVQLFLVGWGRAEGPAVVP